VRAQTYCLLLAALALSACTAETGPAGPEPTPSPSVRLSSSTSPTTLPANGFVAYAEGGGYEFVPWADRVTYYVHGERYASMTAFEAERRGNWLGCLPDATSYEGRGCPVSPLRTIRLADAPVVEDEAPSVIGCNKARPPADVVYDYALWVRPAAADRDCFSDFAVTVYVDADGRISAVDLALSGP